jgi:UrcA family protein
MKISHFVAGVVLACSVVTAAHPTSSVHSERQRVVSFSDLDLSKRSDMERLESRIRFAAREVCWIPGVASVLYTKSMHKCAKDTAARAIAQVTMYAATRYPQRSVSIRLPAARE